MPIRANLTLLVFLPNFWFFIFCVAKPNSNVEGSPNTPPSDSQTPAGCPRIQLDSDAAYLEVVSDFTEKGLSPSRLLLSPTSHTRCKSQGVTCASDLPATDWKFSLAPPL